MATDTHDNYSGAAHARLRGILRRALLIGTGLLALGYCVAVVAGGVDSANRLSTAELVLVFAVLVLVVLGGTISEYSVRNLTLGTAGISAQFDRVEARQSALESEVRALQVALTGLVTKFEVVHLEKLASDGPATVRFGEIMLGELTHLDAMRFVRPTGPRGLNTIREDQGSGTNDFDLKNYVEITQEGLEYLALQAQLSARTAVAHTR